MVHAAFLKYMAPLLGWTTAPETRGIIDSVCGNDLRRLLHSSAAMWNRRGPEDTIVDVLYTLTLARARIWSWFDFRWILGETGLGEAHDGHDPWTVYLPADIESGQVIDGSTGFTNLMAGSATSVSVPDGFLGTVGHGCRIQILSSPQRGHGAVIDTVVGSTANLLTVENTISATFAHAQWRVIDPTFRPDDDHRSNLRIVDDGTLNRTLIKQVLRLMRAAGESFDITYLLLLDLFDRDDNTQWSTPSVITTGRLRMVGAALERVVAIAALAPTWHDYMVIALLAGDAGGPFGIVFYSRNVENQYWAAFDLGAQTLTLTEIYLGSENVLATVDLRAVDYVVMPDREVALRVTIVHTGSGARITIQADGAMLVDVTTPENLTYGSVGFQHAAGATMVAREIEVMAVPGDTDTLQINERA